MLKIDLAITITSVIALVAMVSPIITAVINNRYQLKIKQMDYQQERYRQKHEHKVELCENYLRNIANLSINGIELTYEKLEEFSQSYYLLVPYIPSNKSKYFQDYTDALANGKDLSELKDTFKNQIIPCINELCSNKML